MSSRKSLIRLSKSRPTSKAFSQADTAISMEASPILDHQQRSRISWQGGLTKQHEGTIADRSLLDERLKERRQSAGTTDSSPTDPAYAPTSTVRFVISNPKDDLVPYKKRSKLANQSYFETDTDSSNDDSPVVARASSVRVATPRIIEHSPSRGAHHLRQSFSRASRSLSGVLETSNDDIEQTEQVPLNDSHLEALQLLESNDRVSDTPSPITLSETSPAVERPLLSPIERLTLAGSLNSHPVMQPHETRISRANTSPLPRNAARRVRIKPTDLVITHAKDKRFRESVVTTPYPGGIVPVTYSESKENLDSPKVRALPQKASPGRDSHKSLDRFPSPHQSEILFLDVGLASHPGMVVTLEIKITDKTTYDDEMLFRQIRLAYFGRLLGWSRLPFFLIRSISHVTISAKSEATPSDDFNSTSFHSHMMNPQIGRKRKTWVIWLRNHNRPEIQSPMTQSWRQNYSGFQIQKRPLPLRPAEKRLSTSSTSSTASNVPSSQPFSSIRIPFSRGHQIIIADSRHKSENQQAEKQTEHHIRTPPNTAATYRSGSTFSESGVLSHTKLEIHHSFNFWSLAVLFLLIILSSIASTVLWIIFGVPGQRPGDSAIDIPVMPLIGELATRQSLGVSSWEVNAQHRVLTGLVLGMLVLLLGTLMEGILILGGWILL